MHLSHNNPRNIYNMDDVNIKAKEGGKDLGMLIDYKLDFG